MKLLEAVADSQSQVSQLARKQKRPQTAPSGRRQRGKSGSPAGATDDGAGGAGVAPKMLDTSMRRGTYFGFSTGKAEMLHKRIGSDAGASDGTIFSKTTSEVERSGFAAQLDATPERSQTPTRPESSNTSHRRGTYFGATHSRSGERSKAEVLRARTNRKLKMAEKEKLAVEAEEGRKAGKKVLPSLAVEQRAGGRTDVDGPTTCAQPLRGESKKGTFFGFDDGKVNRVRSVLPRDFE